MQDRIIKKFLSILLLLFFSLISRVNSEIVDNDNYLIIPVGETYTLHGEHSYNEYIEISGTLYITSYISTDETTGGISLTAPEVRINFTGSINMDGSGYPGGESRTDGNGPGAGGGGYYGGGAGYGGYGGDAPYASGGGVYGMLEEPSELGSGGGGGYRSNAGDPGRYGYRAGGGSGGSIWITAGVIEGVDVIGTSWPEAAPLFLKYFLNYFP